MWCDDLRPSNILVDENLQIVAVLDLEFAYAAPAEFSYAPPWWLIIEQPEYWLHGLESWTTVFETRLLTFLKAMTASEDAAIVSGRLSEGECLSEKMRDSYENGDFWAMYAAWKNFMFDEIFWNKIYPRFFGLGGLPPGDAWRDWLPKLTAREQEELQSLVDRKMKEIETRVLVWEPEEPALAQ